MRKGGLLRGIEELDRIQESGMLSDIEMDMRSKTQRSSRRFWLRKMFAGGRRPKSMG